MKRLAAGAAVVALIAGGAVLWSMAGSQRPEWTRATATAAVGGALHPQQTPRPTQPQEQAARSARSASALAEIAERDKSREEMVRAIKRELARVGCYAGPLDADWSDATVAGMRAFSQHLGLPIKDEAPNHVLLTLLEGYRGVACRLTCPAGMVAGPDGACRAETAARATPSPAAAPRSEAAVAKSEPPPAVAAALPAPSVTASKSQSELPAPGVVLPPPIIPPPSSPSLTTPPQSQPKAVRVERKSSPLVEPQVKAVPKPERASTRRPVAKRGERTRAGEASEIAQRTAARTTRPPQSRGRDPYTIAETGAISRPAYVGRPEHENGR